MAPDLALVCGILLILLGCALAGWWLAESRIRDLERDLDAAIGWHERRSLDAAVVHTTLQLTDRGEA